MVELDSNPVGLTSEPKFLHQAQDGLKKVWMTVGFSSLSVLVSLAHSTLAAAQTQAASASGLEPQCGRWRDGRWAEGVRNLLPSHSSEAQTHPKRHFQ